MANIGKSITIKGDLSGNEDLQIDGSVEGRIDLPNNQLTVGAEGRVKAEVHAKSVVVIGHVTGNLLAADRIQVEATGIVDGDVKAPRLVIEEGATLNGSVEMTSGTSKPNLSVQPLAKAAGGLSGRGSATPSL
jgi:cytoskeletal protein CcmA (bactofilin family)